MNYVFRDIPLAERPDYLAYVDWYTPFSREPERHHRQFKIAPSPAPGGGNLASVVPLSWIVSSVYLIPKFGPVCNRYWKSSTVLDQCPQFYVNSFGDHDRDIHDLLNSY
jgi:hypothetical protein